MSEEEKVEKAPEQGEGQEEGKFPVARRKVVACWPQIYVFVRPILVSVNQISYSKPRILRNFPYKQCSILTSCTAKEMPFLQQQYPILLSCCNSYLCRGGSTVLLLCSHSKCVFHFLTMLKNSIKFLLIT